MYFNQIVTLKYKFIKMEKEIQIIELRNRVISLKWQPFDAEVDMDDLTIIHYDNLVGEVLTIATLMNKVGTLKADAENALNTTKLSHKMLEARKANHYRKTLVSIVNERTKLPTVDQVADAVILDEEVSASKRNYYDMVRQAEIVDSLYWSVKAKEKKLDNITMSIVPEDFENKLVEGSINSVMIKMNQKKF